MCCPNSFRSSSISPIDFGLNVSALTRVHGVEQDQTCYGGLTPEYYWGDVWSVDDSSIASIDGTGDAADLTGVAAGTVTVTGQWEVYNFTMEHDIDGPYCVEEDDLTQPQGQVEVLHIDWTTPHTAGQTPIHITIGGVPLASASPTP